MGQIISPKPATKKIRCTQCQGTGKIHDKTCASCKGTGQQDLLLG